MHIDEPGSGAPQQDTPGWQFAVAGGILGWVLDAFDFFVITFLITELMAKYDVPKSGIVWSLALTLAMRPVGALLFGSLADKYGRKKPLMICVVYFSAITILTGYAAPTYTIFLVLRALYGLGMGGYWGIGASYSMESAPRRLRGVLSGLMQGGYPFGYLCAAVAMQFIPSSRLGWRGMFLVGSIVAVLIVVVTTFAPESDAWKMHKKPSLATMFRILFQHIGVFAYLLLLMTVMSCLSHGTQDLYPDFLRTLPFMNGTKIIAMKATLGIPVLYNIAAIVGALIIGQLSEKLGRRYAIILALLISLLSIPAWAFGHSVLTIVIGACLMQFGVQGSFGVIPAHLNELSPDAIRGLFPGFVYQLGVLVASPILPAQNLLRQYVGYPWALTIFETSVIIALLFIYFFGPENRGRDFRKKDTQDFRIETSVKG